MPGKYDITKPSESLHRVLRLDRHVVLRPKGEALRKRRPWADPRGWDVFHPF